MSVQFEDVKSPDFRYIYATGAFGGISPNDARIIFFLDRLVPKTVGEGDQKGSQVTEKIIRELQVEVHMSPQEFVTIWRWMGERLKIYENSFPDFPLQMQEKQETKKETKE